jgi:hypothetical protein
VNILARVISFIFHPLLMATYFFGLLYFFLPSALFPIPQDKQPVFVGVISFMTFVLPALGISMLRTVGAISSFTMLDRRERIRPFFLITIVYLFFTYFFSFKQGLGLEDNFFKFLLIIDLLVIVATAITFYFKVSIHSIGIMGILGVVLPLNNMVESNTLFIPTIVIILIAGLVMSARLQLNSHTSREVWVGALTGFLIGFLGMTFLF